VNANFDQVAAGRPGPFLPTSLPQYNDALILYWFGAAVQHDKSQDPDARNQYLGWIRERVEKTS
jgi:hypothetical protein